MNPIIWLNDNLPPMDSKKRKVIEFMFLWQEYNHEYNKNVPSLGDRGGALSLANCQRAQHEYNALKRDFILSFSQIPSNFDNNNPRTKLCADYSSEQVIKYDSNRKDTLEDFLKVIYQIRCNFLHGGKMRENENIDIELIGWAKDCLEKLLNRINYFQN